MTSQVDNDTQSDHYMYTVEKRRAIRRAVVNHNIQVKDALSELKEVRDKLEITVTAQNHKMLDQLGQVRTTLSRIKQLNESFIEELTDKEIAHD